MGAIREGALWEKSLWWRETLFCKCCLDPASLGQLALLFGGRKHGSQARQSGDPVALEREWTCRRPPRPPYTAPPPGGWSCSTDRLCAESRGASKGELRPLELVSQPQFLSVVLKESVESADWAVLLHPRTVGLQLLAGRGEKPGREATSPSASSHLTGFKCPRCRMGRSLCGDTNPGQGLAWLCL